MTPNSEKDLDNSDHTNVDQQVKDESDSWVPLKIEEAEKKSTEFEESWQNFTDDGLQGKGLKTKPI